MSAATAPRGGHHRAAGGHAGTRARVPAGVHRARASATSSATTARSARCIRPTSSAVRATARSPGADDALVTRWSQLRRIAVHARFNCQDPDTLHRLLTNAAARAGDRREARRARAHARVRRHQRRLRERAGGGPRRADRVRRGSRRAAARDREARVGRGVGEVRAHDHGAVGPLRLRGAGACGGPRVRHELGLALGDVGAGGARRHGAVPQGGGLCRVDAEPVAVRARHAPVRDGLGRRRRTCR